MKTNKINNGKPAILTIVVVAIVALVLSHSNIAFADEVATDSGVHDAITGGDEGKLVNAISPPAVVSESAAGAPLCCCIYEFAGPPKTYKGACHKNYCKVTDLGNYLPDKDLCPREFPAGKRTVYYYTASSEKGYFKSW